MTNDQASMTNETAAELSAAHCAQGALIVARLKRAEWMIYGAIAVWLALDCWALSNGMRSRELLHEADVHRRNALQLENEAKLQLDVLRRSIYVLPDPELSLPPELKRELEA